MRLSKTAFSAMSDLRTNVPRGFWWRADICAALFSVFVACLLSGCNSQLTRGHARERIVEELKLPSEVAGTLELFSRYKPIVDSSEFMRTLQDQDLVTVKPIGLIRSADYEPGNYKWPMASLTEKGKRYAVGEAHVTHRDRSGPIQETVEVIFEIVEFGQVTGIAENQLAGTAEVDYTLLHKPTPFGEFVGRQPATTVDRAVFKKYDDGWRLIR